MCASSLRRAASCNASQCGLRCACHQLDRPTNSSPAYAQSKPVFQNGCSIPMRRSQEFVHQHAQRHRIRPHLRRRRSQGVGSLEPVRPLRAFGAVHTRPIGNTEASHPGPRQILFLILRFDPSDCELPTTTQALARVTIWICSSTCPGTGPGWCEPWVAPGGTLCGVQFLARPFVFSSNRSIAAVSAILLCQWFDEPRTFLALIPPPACSRSPSRRRGSD